VSKSYGDPHEVDSADFPGRLCGHPVYRPAHFCGGFKFQQHLLRHRAEQLIADMHQIRLYRSTWADAERLIDRWGVLTKESPIELDRCGLWEGTSENRRELEKGLVQNDELRGTELR